MHTYCTFSYSTQWHDKTMQFVFQIGFMNNCSEIIITVQWPENSADMNPLDDTYLGSHGAEIL